MNITKEQALQTLLHLQQEIELCVKNGDTLTVSHDYLLKLSEVVRALELLDNRYSTLKRLIIEESNNASEFAFEAALKQILIKERLNYTQN